LLKEVAERDNAKLKERQARGKEDDKKRLKQLGYCGGQRRSKDGKGKLCLKPAGFGTSHPGIGYCKYHSGSAPTANISAIKETARLMGAPREMNAVEAIVWCIKITAGEVEWLTERMGEIPQEEWYEFTPLGKQMHVLARERRDRVELLAKLSKDALSLGLAERAIRMAENYGNTIARLLQGLMGDLKLSKQQLAMAPAIIRKHLMLMESNTSPADIELPQLTTGKKAA
jgi:hypothetical protein